VRRLNESFSHEPPLRGGLGKNFKIFIQFHRLQPAFQWGSPSPFLVPDSITKNKKEGMMMNHKQGKGPFFLETTLTN
jgi:hypothetical protein